MAGLPHVLLPVLALPRLSSSSSQPGQVLMVQVSSKRGTEVLRVSGGLGLELATVTLSPIGQSSCNASKGKGVDCIS